MQRRRFLQTAGLLTAGGALARPVWGDEQPMGEAEVIIAPAFAEEPGFEPDSLFLTWQQDPTTTMTIQWIGQESDGADRPIWYAREGEMEWQMMPATPKPFPTMDLTIFRTELTGLEPGTEYRFRVGLDSAEQRFRTMPAKATDTIQFVTGGDSGVGMAAERTNVLAGKQDPMFVFIGGDLAYENGRVGRIFHRFLQNYSKQVIDSQGRLIPLLACLGNHEVDGGYRDTREAAPFFYAFFDGLYPETGYAKLDFGDYMSCIFLDTNHTTPVAGEQTDWLEKTLAERVENPHLFVFQHVPSYPSVRETNIAEGRGTGVDSRKHWVPLFERYNVDAVFEHHDHAFKRTVPLMDNMYDPNGITYLGDGSWGKLRTPEPPEVRPYLAVVDETYHLTVHRIEGDRRHHVALSDAGRVTDVFTSTKRART